MSNDIAITVRGLGKSYTLHHQAEAGAKGFRNFFRKAHSAETRETFWALKDISFDIARGQVFGVIGRNGAGKSTLLKILSRITEPTTGHADIHGRVGSLLEVGTGFHPELTGRENIYLNGTLLGMRKKQIDKIFDEIVAFSEIEKFLDTPVKRYSSGMYVRLAFAVAAHLEPEILIIDEVLAVGDMQFQKKCLGKMKDVTGQGRTVLFVSHNLTTVNSLCDRCLLLDQGMVELEGTTEDVTNRYFSSLNSEGGCSISFLDKHMPGDSEARLCSAKLMDQSEKKIEFARIEQDIGIEIIFEVLSKQLNCIPNFHVFTQGQCVFVGAPKIEHPLSCGLHRATMWIPGNFLNEGTYVVNLALSTIIPQRVHFHLQDRFFFSVVDNIHSTDRNGYVHAIPGVIRPQTKWTVD